MEVSAGTVEYRAYRPGDERAINDGFNEVFGQARSLEEWRWKFPERPEGRWIMLALDPGGRVLAHYGAVAVQVRFGGAQLRGAQVVDAYSRSEVRGTRVFSTCYQRFVGSFGAPGGLSFIFGFPGRRHYEMGFKVLNYVPITSVPYWVRPVRRRRSLSAWRYGVGEGFEAAAADDLWRRAGERYDVAAVRDAGWLQRRYLGRPGVEYVHLAATRRGRTHARAVARAQDGILRWAELVWDGEDERALDALDVALDRVARRLSCASLELWLGGDPAAERALERFGWERRPCPLDMLLVTVPFEERADMERMRRSFYLTMGDSDLV